MNGKTISKIMLTLIIGVILFTVPATVFAATSNAADLDDLFGEYEDQGEKSDLITEDKKTETSTDTTPENNTSTSNTETNKNNTKTDIPKAGLAENTAGVVAIAVLGITAIYAYKKINEFKNI